MNHNLRSAVLFCFLTLGPALLLNCWLHSKVILLVWSHFSLSSWLSGADSPTCSNGVMSTKSKQSHSKYPTLSSSSSSSSSSSPSSVNYSESNSTDSTKSQQHSSTSNQETRYFFLFFFFAWGGWDGGRGLSLLSEEPEGHLSCSFEQQQRNSSYLQGPYYSSQSQACFSSSALAQAWRLIS